MAENPTPSQVPVVGVRLLTQEEQTLLAEKYALQTASLSNMRDALRSLITISSTINAFLVGFLGIMKFTFKHPFSIKEVLLISTILMLFLTTAFSIIGQLGNLYESSSLDTIEAYRIYRNARLHRGHRWYTIASILFLLGLLGFLGSTVILLIFP